MSPSLNDLQLGNEKLQDANFDDIPENIGQSYPDPLQPGVYRFQLPSKMGDIWTAVDTEKHGKRIQALFEDESALLVVQSPGDTRNGEMYRTRISNIPRERTKEKILVSDMALLLRALGETKTPGSNKEFALALQKYAGKQFSATVEWSYRCDPNNPARWPDGQGGFAEADDHRHGCGTRAYQRDVPKVDGVQPERWTCSNPECGASVRGFTNLGGFKK